MKQIASTNNRLCLAAALALAAFGAPAPGARAGESPGAGEGTSAAPADPQKVRSALERLRGAQGAGERRKALLDLVDLGPGALEEVRKARDAAGGPEDRADLDRAARELLARKLKPLLAERSATLLTFDGQFDDLKAEGPEAAPALLGIFDDEETPPAVRIAAAHALADLKGQDLLPALRKIEEDPLLAWRLREEAGILMAILGDPSRVDRKIRELAAKAETKSLDRIQRRGDGELLAVCQENLDLSNLYYRIRQYKKAIDCYDRTLKALVELRSRRRGSLQIERELALAYYNAACSLSLDGQVDRAKEMLRKSVEIDPTHLRNLDKDGDLRKVREAPKYEDFKKDLEKPLEKRSI